MVCLDYNLNWGESFRLGVISPSGLLKTKSRTGKNIEGYNVGTQFFQKSGKPDSWRLRFQQKTYQVHRIIWVLTYGSINSEMVIDHLDGNPFNNKIENLSLKSQKNNSMNKCKYTNNKTGITGVVLETKIGYLYYTAYWCEIDGKHRQKCFSILKLGEEKAKELAITYREEQIKRLLLEGAGYTDRHGN